MNDRRPRRQSGRILRYTSLVLLVCAPFFLLHYRPHGPNVPASGGSTPQPLPAYDPLLHLPADYRSEPQALVYPLSVVPGGVSSPEQLRSAMAADPVVARHYAGFSLRATRVIQLEAPRLAYVSYRRGNDIFWTRHKVRIPAGERLLSDGANLARTRCGNRLSDVPQNPTSPKDPAPEVMDHPVPQPPPLILDPEPLFSEEWAPQQPYSPLPPPAGLAPPPAGVDPPFDFGYGPFPFPLGAPLGSSGREPLTPPVAPPVATPEPATFVLLLVGASCLAFFGKRSHSAR